MLTTATFIIRPKAELQQRLSKTALAGTPFVEEAVLWTHELPDRVGWSRAEVVDGVKALYVAFSQTTYCSAADWAHLTGDLDAASPSDIFDRYWVVEVFWDVDDTVEEVAKSVSLGGVTNPFLLALSKGAPS